MTSEEMERAIEFLLDHHAKVSAEIERHSEQVGKLTEAVAATQAQLESTIYEMREGFNNLIVANEVTRNLAEEATKLAIQTSRRVTRLEDKAS